MNNLINSNIVFLKLALCALFAGIFYLVYGHTVSYGLFLIGLGLGANFFLMDAYVQVMLTRFHFYKQIAANAPVRPVSQSLIFIFCYIFLAIFVVTSSGSSMGNGLIFGIGIEFVLFLLPLFQFPEQKRHEFFPELSKTVTSSQVKQAVVLFWLFFVGLTLFRII